MASGYAGIMTQAETTQTQTELERLYERFAGTSRRLGEMLDQMESKIDPVTSAPTTLNQAVGAIQRETPPPPHAPGTIAALDQLADNLRERADKLDQQLCRLGAII